MRRSSHGESSVLLTMSAVLFHRSLEELHALIDSVIAGIKLALDGYGLWSIVLQQIIALKTIESKFYVATPYAGLISALGMTSIIIA